MVNQIAKLSADERFKYVENRIIKLHKESAGARPIRSYCSSSFDEWATKAKNIKDQIHKSVVDYYNDLDFVSRYNLGIYPWANDPDIKALLQILQMRGRAKAASKLEKLEAEIDDVAGKIAKLESGGRYYREDVINLSTTFDKLHISIRIENDRGRKRQQSLDKMAAAPFKAAEKAKDFGCAVIAIIFGIGICIGVPILIILNICGVIR